MGFPLVPKSVTLNDLARRNDKTLILHYFTEFGTPGANHVKVAEVRPYVCQKCSPKNLVFGSI